jgi:hypothetical protein
MYKIQQIFNMVKLNSVSTNQIKAFHAIRSCRTPKLGMHINHCKSCNHSEVLFNSCRNRHCPICQGSKQHEWVQAQLKKLLPVSYFHVVFTLPHELNSIILQNQEIMYSILLKSAAETLKELALDSKYLGAQIGITEVLHTWGQNLSYHPHVHCLVPGGGISSDGLRFVKSSRKFFLPVKVVSRKFRGKFLAYLKSAWKDSNLKFFNESLEFENEDTFKNLLDELYTKEWVVYCKKPFKTPYHVVKYLGRYTHRVAISDARVQEFDADTVTFKWKDYKNNNKIKIMTLDIMEFVRRFLLHVLPTGFTKIRHYGLLASRNIGTKLLLCIRLIGKAIKKPIEEAPVKCCPVCGNTSFDIYFINNNESGFS